MTQGILLALAAALSYGFLGISFETAGKRRYDVWTFIFYKQITGLAIGLVFTLALGTPLYSTRLIWLGLIGAASYVATLAAYLVASRERDIAANWTILNLSVILPIGVSILWFGDAFTPTKAIGVLFTLLSIALIGGGGGDLAHLWRDSAWMRCILVAFLLNGVLAMLFRFVPEGGGALFTVYFYGISFLMAAPYKWKAAQPIDKGLLGLSALGAATHWVGIMCTMAALRRWNPSPIKPA